jgi:HAD superfamily hydrolase (TIGR01509 family)
MKIEAIIFDLGGVVIFDGYKVVTKVAQLTEIPFEEAFEIWNKLSQKFCLGKIKEMDLWKAFAEKSAIQNSPKELMKIFRERYNEIPGSFNLLKKLHNYKLAALTDNSEEWLNFQKKKFHLEKYFPVIVTSYQVGVTKPNKKIFMHAVNALDVNPQKCVFIDDKEINLMGAKEVGMYTVLCKNENISKVEDDLRGLGVKI